MNQHLVFSTIVFLLAACGDGDQSPNGNEGRIPVPGFDLLEPGNFQLIKNISTASESLQLAAQAVVKIERLDGTVGTGAFAEDPSLLFTNAHVLGHHECALSGCTVRLHLDHHRTASPTTSTPSSGWFTLLPHSYSEKLDVAIFRVFRGNTTTAPHIHPHFLSLADLPERSDEQRVQLNLIAAPLGFLTKSISGTVVNQSPPYLSSEMLTLPGTSGGPLVNNEGQMVAIHHRGTQKIEYLRNGSYFGVSLATDANALRSLLDESSRRATLAPFEEVARSSATSLREEDAISLTTANSLVGNTEQAKDRAEFHWNNCTPEDLLNCQMALALLHCPGGLGHRLPQAFCPTEDSRDTWLQRFENLALSFDDEGSFLWMVRAPLKINHGNAPEHFRRWYERSGSQQRVGDGVRALDVTQQPELAGQETRNWFTKYKTVPNYHFQFAEFIRGIYLLGAQNHENREAMLALLSEIPEDPRATLYDFLLADYLAWRLTVSVGGEEDPSPYALP